MRNRGKNLHAAGCKKTINMLKTIQPLKEKWKSFAVSKKEIKFCQSEEKIQIHVWKIFTKLQI